MACAESLFKLSVRPFIAYRPGTASKMPVPLYSSVVKSGGGRRKGRGRSGNGNQKKARGRGGGRGRGRGRGRGAGHGASRNQFRSVAGGRNTSLTAPVAGIGSALQDKDRPFISPQPRSLLPVPLEFSSVSQWCSLIAHNLLAEFWHVYREGRAGAGGGKCKSLRARPVSNSELMLQTLDRAAPYEPMVQNLLLIDGQPHIVVSQTDIPGATEVKVKVKPGIRSSCARVTSLGFIGSYIR